MSPASTSSPRRTAIDARNEYEVRRLPACATTTGSDPATVPANDTTPGPAARTLVPVPAARSAPRWPAPKRDCGGSNGRTTAPPTGRIHTVEDAACAPDGTTRTTRTSTTSTTTATSTT